MESLNDSSESKYEESLNLHIVFLTEYVSFAIWHETIFTSSLFVRANRIVSESHPALFRVIGWLACPETVLRSSLESRSDNFSSLLSITVTS